MGKFVISQNKVGMYGFCLKAGNGQVILFSEDYCTEASCLNGIESVKKNSYNISRFEKLNIGRKLRFNLKAGNGQIIGTSFYYESEDALDNGIKSVQKNAPDAKIINE